MKKVILPKMASCLKVESKPHLFCPGCGHGIILKNLGLVIDELKIADQTVFLMDIGCSLLAWDFFNLPSSQTHHGRTTATAVGYKLAVPSKIVIAYMGDGGGYAIGLQNLIHACLRNTAISVILVNNANYGMTGGQMAPTTLIGQKTDSTPYGKKEENFGQPLFGPELLSKVANRNAYLARTSVSKPLLLKMAIKKCLENQINQKSFSFLEILSFCPTNWHTNARETFDFIKVMETFFPVGEIKIK
jgi:2-oxoglutarate/2-oxoacid ferredoxin oxidoreductase subunit beta